jgi:hypothetical protein
LTPQAGASHADHSAITESSVPLLDAGATDPTSDEGDAALSIDSGEADQSATSEDPATTPEANDTEPTFDGDALGSAVPIGGIDPSSGAASGPFDGGDADPSANPEDPGAWLSQHLHMLHRLAADYHNDGLLLVRFLDVDAETGEESILTDWLKYEDFDVLAGMGHFEKANVNTPKRMVSAIMELTAGERRHVSAPLAVMDYNLSAGSWGDSDYIVAVLGVVAHLEGVADYNDQLPLHPDYVLGCGDQVQAFFLLDEPATVAEAEPVAAAVRDFAKCRPTIVDVAHGWWVPGTVRWRVKGPEPVQVIKSWDGASRTSLADLRAALGLPEPKVPSATVALTKQQWDVEDDEEEFEADPWPKSLGAAAFHGLAGEFVDTVFPHSEADQAALLLQFLTPFGNAIGRDPHALVEDHHHAGNLFVAIVGASGTSRKGTSWGRSYDVYKRADPDWAGHCIMNGLSTGEGLIHQVRDPIEKRERVKGKEEGDQDSYQTVVIDNGVDDKRLLVVEPELARTFRVMTRDGNTLSAVMRMAWDGADPPSGPRRARRWLRQPVPVRLRTAFEVPAGGRGIGEGRPGEAGREAAQRARDRAQDRPRAARRRGARAVGGDVPRAVAGPARPSRRRDSSCRSPGAPAVSDLRLAGWVEQGADRAPRSGARGVAL